MLLLPIILIALATGTLVFLLLNRPHKAEDQKVAAEQARVNLAQTRATYEGLEHRLFDIIEKQIGKKYIREIREGEITVGMPSELLLMAWGHPAAIKEQPEEGGPEATWIYPQEDSGTGRSNTEVQIFDKKVQGWKDN
ncbi:hypothetical protein [Niabella drilacis]|uniref:Uncharacterized protein n=1 Tax=Niabella drilacis (strain DSM 25811 / CCM 8410 / CCUG 62505 / LMG 26954 / E90) TaxID=1285928 RepID=A0A1G6VMP6_NIADE|nr:hypothetical protein [Niabella drilacis]SDD54859.1 hypothetical protein SAMN04487894_11086 [Niabella drilacis]